MDSEIGNIEAAESERLLSGNVVKPHIYGSKEPVCLYAKYHLQLQRVLLFSLLLLFRFVCLCFIYKQSTLYFYVIYVSFCS